MTLRATRRIGFLLACLVALPLSADAQTDNKLAVGIDVTQRMPRGPSAHGDTDVGFSWRLGRATEGWGWTFGFGWFSTDFDRPIGPRTVEFGELKVKPFMGGYGYTHVMGPTAVTVKLLGGYAVTSFDLTPVAVDAYRDVLGRHAVSGDAGNTFVVRPEIAVWRDVNRKIGLRVSAGYAIARPVITIRSATGTEKWRYNADSFAVKAGFVYSVF